MNRLRRTLSLAAVSTALLCARLASGQPAFPAADLPAPARSIPELKSGPSPVELFRQLLAMSPEERTKQLANRPPETQKRIEAKLDEYSLLPPDERELRLRATELYWYLHPLMSLSPAERGPRLAQIPPEIRQLVESRLEVWDLYPPPMKQELLENETAVRWFMRPEYKEAPGATGNPTTQADLNNGIRHWQSLSEQQRNLVCRHFDQFFDLTPDEKQAALDKLPESERQQMEQTLAAFEKMPRDQRELCIRSFDQFATLSPAQRDQFLKNAEQWQSMSPEDRQHWRDLVAQVPEWPPMPPNFPTPPLPPGTSSSSN